MTWCRRKRAARPTQPEAQPQERESMRRKPAPPADTGGARARREAERELAESRARRQREMPLRRWFRVEYEENGWQRDVDAAWGGKA